LIALVLGVVLGLVLHPFSGSGSSVDAGWVTQAVTAFNEHFLQPIGQIFLRLILMVVVPLIFSALVLGVFELGESRGLGQVATKTLLYTLIASSASVIIGVTLVNLLQPGRSIALNPELLTQQTTLQTPSIQTIQKNASEAKSFSQTLVELVPRNPIDSAARALSGEIIAFMVFALIFGIALSLVSDRDPSRPEKNPIVALLEQLYAVSMKIIDFAMALAPVAVFALVFGTVFKLGIGVIGSLFFYVATVVAGLLIQQFVVYPLLLSTIAKRNPWQFFRQCREVFLYAFSTASSNATLPKSLDTAINRLKLSPEISRFVLTIGSTANQNGTALFEGITVLFLAQVYGIELGLGQQLQVVFMSILAGIGTAGVPGGSLPLIMILVQSLGIPPEGMGLILGVDRFLDMCRTTLNVSGDLVIAALVDAKAGGPAYADSPTLGKSS
jgi:DAACS family dicarboxylate/amino acid:cation (Na+ or H+) symporter